MTPRCSIILNHYDSLPIEWEFDRDELDLWVNLVDLSFLTASACKISPNTVLQSITCDIDVGHNPKGLYSVLPFLLSGIDASGPSCAPWLPLSLLTLTSSVLASNYPPADAGIRLMLFSVLKSLTELVEITCKELIVELLVHIQGGVTVWIQDDTNAFSDAEFNEKVSQLLCTHCLSYPPLDLACLYSVFRSTESCFVIL